MADGTAAPASPDEGFVDDRTHEGSRVAHELLVQRFLQPDDVTCGPTCLRKVYHYYGLQVEPAQVLGEIDRNEDGGTLAVFLGISALGRGFRARIFSYDLRIFDPTWFDLPMPALAEKVHARIPYLSTAKTIRAARAYLTFLERGGELCFDELTLGLLKRILDRDHPVLAGLSATYLYRWKRERQLEGVDELVPDDVRGEPTGHFIVISGYEQWGRRFSLRDPSAHVPEAEGGRQVVDAQRLINAILLGDLTYDAVLLEIWPPEEGSA
ncbi:MAG TPA: hypothetical protein VHG28_18910 [Longimicrobiaceae bacterium]|nr:hypothetical protein [Longimicrobiaceae bacterium]